MKGLQIPLWGTVAKAEIAWRPPTLSSLPSWAEAKRISIDLETHDPQLDSLGPGVRRGGYVIGCSFKIEDGPKHYLPIRHLEDNLPADAVWAYLLEQSQVFKGELVGANINYDLDYLWENKVMFPNVSMFRDVQVAEPLIDELQLSYSLDNIGIRYGLPGKDERVLRDGAKTYGLHPKKDMYRLPARFVGEYAEQDVALPLQILRRQERIIEERELGKVYELESKLTPILIKMRRRGVAIDPKALEAVEQWSIEEENKELAKIYTLTGCRLSSEDLNKSAALVKPLKQALPGLRFNMTTAKVPKESIDKEFLAGLKHPVADAIKRGRKFNKLRNTFCNSIREHAINWRIHATFNQMRKSSDDEDADDQGARYGRLSGSDPNLQQMPARDPETGQRWRTIFIPDAGKLWAAIDYSQAEPRLTYHYAYISNCTGAYRIIERFCKDLKADSHTEFAKLCWTDAVLAAPDFKKKRGYAKELFLGLTYSMGGGKLCRKLGLPTAMKYIERLQKTIEVAGPEGQEILDTVDRQMPFLKQLARLCEARAKQVGFIKTILGRHCHFPKNEDGTYDWCHKALNRLIQGSSADQMKQAIVNCDAAGFYLQLTVHDELDTSVSSPEEAEGIAQVMRTAVPLSLPVKVDVELGTSWGASMN